MRTLPSLEVFDALAQEDQLSYLTSDGELLPPSNDPQISYYKLGDFYARVLLASAPMRVRGVQGFREGEPYEAMVADLKA